MTDVPFVRLLSMAVTVALEDLHRELARRGHGSLRPAHGYTLNAVLNGRNTASLIAPMLGMTKQGAAKLVQSLLDDGYLSVDESAVGDGRRKPLALTKRGEDAVRISVEAQSRIEAAWADAVGVRRMTTARIALETAVLQASGGELPPIRLGW